MSDLTKEWRVFHGYQGQASLAARLTAITERGYHVFSIIPVAGDQLLIVTWFHDDELPSDADFDEPLV